MAIWYTYRRIRMTTDEYEKIGARRGDDGAASAVFPCE